MLLPLALTMGEPAGIGGDIALAAWSRRAEGVPPFFLLDDPKRMAALASRLGLNVPLQAIEAVEEAAGAFPRALPILPVPLPFPCQPGAVDSRNGRAVLDAIRLGVRLVKAGRASGLVTNPIHKASLYAAGLAHPGHTEFLAELDGGGVSPVMMLACGQLRVVPVTIHEPLRRVAELLDAPSIVHAGKLLAQSLVLDFGIAQPRLAVAGLNPHAGEGGAMGDEEERIIAPAIASLKAAGIDVQGPLSADTMFHAEARASYDGALCMYHDQALIPIKTIDFAHGVNATLGLSFVRTSPDHGTALALAGSGRADPSSLIAALRMAALMAGHRRAQPSRA
jgi:4-hydroxythreonine-4-phosphate dehydrogenase